MEQSQLLYDTKHKRVLKSMGDGFKELQVKTISEEFCGALNQNSEKESRTYHWGICRTPPNLKKCVSVEQEQFDYFINRVEPGALLLQKATEFRREYMFNNDNIELISCRLEEFTVGDLFSDNAITVKNWDFAGDDEIKLQIKEFLQAIDHTNDKIVAVIVEKDGVKYHGVGYMLYSSVYDKFITWMPTINADASTRLDGIIPVGEKFDNFPAISGDHITNELIHSVSDNLKDCINNFFSAIDTFRFDVVNSGLAFYDFFDVVECGTDFLKQIAFYTAAGFYEQKDEKNEHEFVIID